MERVELPDLGLLNAITRSREVTVLKAELDLRPQMVDVTRALLLLQTILSCALSIHTTQYLTTGTREGGPAHHEMGGFMRSVDILFSKLP